MKRDALRHAGQDGLSLVELLITLGVFGVVGVGMMRMMGAGVSAQKGVELSSQLQQFSSGLQQILAVPAACKANLAGVAFDSTVTDLQATSLQIHYPRYSGGSVTKGPVFAKSGESVEGWTVSSIGLRIKGQMGPDTFLVAVEASLSKRPGAGGAARSFGSQASAPQSALVTVKTSGTAPNKVIDDCSAASGGGLASFESALLPFPQLTGGRVIEALHGLGKAPSLVRVAVVCVSDDLGHPAGTEMSLSANDTAYQPGWSIYSDATRVGIIFYSTATDPIKFNEATPGYTGNHQKSVPDYSKWRLKLVAYANP